MGGEHRHTNPGKHAASARADHDTPTPGKQTQVQATTREISGIDAVDKFVERRDEPGNFLTETERIQLEREYERYLTLAMHNGRDALLNVSIDLATEKNTGGLGGLFDMAYRFITDWITGGVIGAVGRWTGGDVIKFRGVTLSTKEAAWIRRHVTDGAVKSTLVSGWMGLRTVLKDLSMAHPNNWTEISFLRSSIQEGFSPTIVQMVDAAAMTKDGQLAAMTQAMKAAISNEFTIAAWTQLILDKLNRFDGQHIDDIGESRSMQQPAHKELVNVVSKQGKSRPAIVEFYDPNKTHTHKMYDGKYVDVEQPQFVGWVDDDLYEPAEKRNQDRNKRETVRTIDATRSDTGMRQIDDWARITATPIEATP